MLSVEEARARILAALAPVGTEMVGLAEAAGRVLAVPVTARLTQPPTDVSAMDGFAVRAADVRAGAALRVIGAAPAGHPFAGVVGAGEAVRIFTGSVVPAGADAVLLQEDATAADGAVVPSSSLAAGRHIRRQGQDFAAGDVVLHGGVRLGARAVGLAAAANHPWLSVHRQPRVAILATGDEVALPGEPIPEGGIVSSNSHMLAAMVRAAGGVPTILPVVADDVAAIAAAGAALGGADLLLTTGGASVGAHDLVQEGLLGAGFALDFWKIAMRPGKPMIFGRVGAVPMLGLPGNPVSAFVCAVLFALPALARLGGLADWQLPRETARLGGPLPANDHRADHLRATLARDAEGRLVATAFERQDSALLTVLAGAGCLIPRAPHARAVAARTEVEVVPLAWLGM